MLNQAIGRSQKQSGVKGSKTESLTRRSDAKPQLQRPGTKAGNLAKPKENRYGLRSEPTNGLKDDVILLGPNDVTEHDDPPRKHATRQSNTNAVAETSSTPTESQPRKRSYIPPVRKARVSTKKPASSHSIQLSELPNTVPSVPHEADDLTGNSPPKAQRGRPRKNKPEPASSKDNVDVGEAADDPEEEEPEEAANIATLGNLPNSREQSPDSANASNVSGEYPDSNILHQPQDPHGRMEVDLADLEVFNTMKTTLAHGYRDLKENISERPRTGLKAVKTLNNNLKSLTNLYADLRGSRMLGAAQDKANTNTFRHTFIKRITLQSQKLDLEEESVLAAVYIVLMPTFVEAIRVGVHAHNITEPISTASLNEILTLLDSVYNLGLKAVRQPYQLQPRAKDRVSSIRGPTVTILPLIRGVWQSFISELRARQKAEERADCERVSAEEKKREEEEEAERLWQLGQKAAELEKRQKAKAERKIRMNNLHRHQRQALDAKLADPLFAKWIRRESAQPEPKSNTWRKESIYGTQNLEVTRSAHPLATLDYEELARNDKRAGEDRKSVNVLNQREQRRLARQSNEAKIIFIDTMRSERGSIP